MKSSIEAIRECGRVETGTVAEQRVMPARAGQPTPMTVRRIAVRLDRPTRDGDATPYVLTNLLPEAAPATGVARVYLGALAPGDRVPNAGYGLNRRDRYPGPTPRPPCLASPLRWRPTTCRPPPRRP